MRTLPKSAESQYTESEVAEELGLSVEGLRSFIQNRLLAGDEDVREAPALTFQPSDLLLLRVLVSQAESEALQG